MSGRQTIVAFANPGRTAAKFMSAFEKDGIKFDAIFIEMPDLRQKADRSKKTKGAFINNPVKIAKRAVEKLRHKAVDCFHETVYRLSKAMGAPPPGCLPPWTINRQHYRPEYYARFTTELIMMPGFNDNETAMQLAKIRPDVIVMCGVTRIIKEHIIGIPRIGILNAHPGALPKYRGRDAVLHELINGDPLEVTVHQVDKGIDSGPVLEAGKISISKGDSIETLWAATEDLGARLMVKAVRSIMDGTCRSRPQVESMACYRRAVTQSQRSEAEKRLRNIQKVLE